MKSPVPSQLSLKPADRNWGAIKHPRLGYEKTIVTSNIIAEPFPTTANRSSRKRLNTAPGVDIVLNIEF